MSQNRRIFWEYKKIYKTGELRIFFGKNYYFQEVLNCVTPSGIERVIFKPTERVEKPIEFLLEDEFSLPPILPLASEIDVDSSIPSILYSDDANNQHPAKKRLKTLLHKVSFKIFIEEIKISFFCTCLKISKRCQFFNKSYFISFQFIW